MRNTTRFFTFLKLAIVLALPTVILAQSESPVTSVQDSQEAQVQKPTDAQQREMVRLIVSIGIDNFVKDLSENGRAGYRLYKSLNYGGEGVTQRFAAVLRLDAGNKYEYDWLSSPDKRLLESRLNYEAKQGFNFISAYALTACSSGTSEEKANPTSPESLIFRLQKGDAFLVERKNGSQEQTKEYKVAIAKVRLGDSAEKDLQKAITDSSPEGFRPSKILFARQGLLDFSISILMERDLPSDNSSKLEHLFLKKTSGLPKEINAAAAQGFRFITGRRIGMIGLVLMAKHANNATTYSFIDEKKFAKEFDKTIAAGNSYQGAMMGDLTCGSTEVENERLVFAQNTASEKHEYRIVNVATTNNSGLTVEALQEFQRLLREDYQAKDLFYSGGLYVIFEK